MSTPVEGAHKAREKAWSAALQVSGEDRQIASKVMDKAELEVLRKIAADYLDDGEEGYWNMVFREVTS